MMEWQMGMAAALGGAAALWALHRVFGAGAAAGGRRALAALGSVGRLTELIAQVQQHRGMSGAWLAGDASFANRLPARQAAVAALFDALVEDATREDFERLPCFGSAELEALQRDWQQLVEQLPRLSPEESFLRHCRLIAVVLGWLGALGEARIAQQGAANLAPAVRKAVADLPALAECLGQARALGSAVAARGRCAPVARVRLHFLVSRAGGLLARAAQGAGAGAARPVGAFLQALRERVLQGERVGMDAATCFRLGTEAVDAVYVWLAQERSGIEHALHGLPSARPRWGERAGVRG
ncbi:nitrate- and nitrite sensing domain-containing protein [Azoarcus olearius]|uniref:Conserved hypothetical secreted protein n=1 Tax=Azoarcus sp. (strain BH72) TaxID=418699 RepID=A1K411_AZOSB|nr:nitrate- and nitrite sensing domain-containing protein [Azoarcus olearius]ANQ84088.1 hypothetical protein dqs_1023 [Azoarcus olearius]CAL93566.1 conserved hypothetical secreted protein [Azoarcus olearius]